MSVQRILTFKAGNESAYGSGSRGGGSEGDEEGDTAPGSGLVSMCGVDTRENSSYTDQLDSVFLYEMRLTV